MSTCYVPKERSNVPVTYSVFEAGMMPLAIEASHSSHLEAGTLRN